MLARFSALLLLLTLSGCAAVTAVSAIPGALFEYAASQFAGKEKSYPASMRRTLSGVQQGLQSLKLDVDVLEVQRDGGYGVGFGNERLDGEITLRTQTAELTTIYVKVRGNSREESVEHAIIEVIDEKLKQLPQSASLSTSSYNNIRQEPSARSARVGWFRPGASLEVSRSGVKDWLKIKLPSGEYAYLKGNIRESDNTQKRKTILTEAE